MKWLKNLLKMGLKSGFRIGYSSGKPFDPRDQKRTDAIKDIIEADKKRKENKKVKGGTKMPGRDGTGPRGGGGKKSGGRRGGC